MAQGPERTPSTASFVALDDTPDLSARVRVVVPEVSPEWFSRAQDLLREARDPVFLLTRAKSPGVVMKAIADRTCDVVLFHCGDTLTAPRAETLNAMARGGSFAVVAVGPPDDRIRKECLRVGVGAYLLAEELSGAVLSLALTTACERASLRRRLADLQERFTLAIRSANDGYWEWTRATGAAFFSRRWRELLGYESSELTGTMNDWVGHVHAEDRYQLAVGLDALLAGETDLHESEHRVRCADGSYRWMRSRSVAQRDQAGEVVRMSGSLTDISDFRARERDLREQSRHDALTGLPRRELFMERLARAVEIARDHPTSGFVVLLVEVERLRMLNESIGHEAGDLVLAEFARRIRSAMDPDILIARFGGAKFAVLLDNTTDYERGSELADRIQEAGQIPFDVGGQPVYLLVSVGYTASERTYARAEDVVSDVTAAATRAKQQPPASQKKERFSTQMRMEALSRVRLEMALRQAVDNQEFSLHYQPIVSLRGGDLVGFEALLRWEHPDRGRVSPAEFIPVAEATGLILPIGRWVLATAAQQLADWHRDFQFEGNLSLSLNLSGRQVADPDLLPAIARTLNTSGVEPSALKMELTESVLMENADQVTGVLDALREMGVQIWVDDFGTGYSSLSYLHRFPVNGLKIDKTFVDRLDGSADGEPMIRTIVSLAEQIEVDLVAEGIEQQGQADRLRELGCPLGQGYLFGRPVAVAEATALIAARVTSPPTRPGPSPSS